MRAMLPRPARTLLACLMLTLTASCVTTDACGWLTKIQPEPGFETRWTRGEKEQAVTLNRNVEKFCR